jgi:PAS domain S-box-containing protein
MTRTIEEREARLREAEELVNAIRSGEVDALVVSGPQGDRVYTLTGAEHTYRVMVEAMNEGAVTLTADGTIIYSNGSFARMVGLSLDQVCGTAMDRHVIPQDLGCYKELLERVGREATRGNIRLVAGGGMTVPVHVSIASFEAGGSSGLCAIVTDLTAHQLHDDAVRRDLQRRLAMSQEDERRRIARDLHDEFGQQLSAFALRLAQLKRDVGRRSGLAKRLAALEALTRQLDQELEQIIWRLRPTALDDLGLVAALESYIRQWAPKSSVACALHANGVGMGEMAGEIETALYRIGQEALNNVAKHAQARNATVLLERSAGRVSLIVEDDGIGFDVAQQLGVRQRFGVTGMRERALLLGGEFDIESTPGKGTTIVARIPLPPRLEEAGDDKGSDCLGRGPQSHARGSADGSRPRTRPGGSRGS